MTDFKAIETQEDFDKAISNRLKRQEETLQKQYQEKYADYDNLKSSNETLKKELADTKKTLDDHKAKAETYDNQINELTSKVTEYEQANLRTNVALSNGIPYDLASRLVGNTEEELIEDAKRFSQFMKDSRPTAPLKSTEQNERQSEEQRLYGNLINTNKF